MKALLLPVIFFSFVPCSYSQSLDSTITGIASYYHTRFNGRKTANGEIFSNDSLTAAHKTLPFGTAVKVVSLSNDKYVVVKINDRLPQNSKRTIDLSQAAAKELGMIKKGLQKVELVIIGSQSKMKTENTVLEGEPFRIEEQEERKDSVVLKEE